MKKIILLLLLCPFAAFAKFIPGTVEFTNGSNKSGLLEIPSFNDSKIAFRTDKDAKTEKFKIEDVKGFTVQIPNGQILQYITLKLGMARLFSDGFKVDKNKSWVLLEKEGTFNIVSASGCIGKIGVLPEVVEVVRLTGLFGFLKRITAHKSIKP